MRRPLASILCAGLLGLLPPALMAAEAGDTSLFQRYATLNARVEQAGQAVAARRFAEAQRFLEPCLQKVPDHFEAHFLLARMAYEGRNFAGALAHMEIAERSLADLDRRYHEEQAALQALDVAEEQAYRDSLDNLAARGADPGGCSANLYLVKQSAIDYLEKKKGHLYDRENPFAVPAGYSFLHGNCLYRLGRKDEALAQYRQAILVDPSQADAWNNLIALLLEVRNLPQARTELARAEAAHVLLRPGLRQAVLGGL